MAQTNQNDLHVIGTPFTTILRIIVNTGQASTVSDFHLDLRELKSLKKGIEVRIEQLEIKKQQREN